MRKNLIALILLCAFIFSFTIAASAQFPGVPVPKPAPQPAAEEKTDDGPQAVEEEFEGFSGELEEYESEDGQYIIAVPVEFELTEEGYTTHWTGPKINDMATSMSVNFVDMPDVNSDVLYQTNLDSYKKKKDYTDVQPVKIKGKGLAFRVKEANHKPGKSSQEKDPNDIHRWHMFVFGNGKFYTMGFCANYQTFKDNKVQDIYEEVIKSVELAPQ
ncbi:MAG: hypothetical protein ABIH00_08960 [Armatimonadota bacterium]